MGKYVNPGNAGFGKIRNVIIRKSGWLRDYGEVVSKRLLYRRISEEI